MLRKQFLLWFMQTSFFNWLVLHVVPYVRFTCYYTSMRGWKFQRGYELLQPGDILLTTDRKKLTTLLIGGEITHAALCVAFAEPFEIAEMTHTHYTKSTFFDLCKEADRVIILRCRDFDPSYIQRMITRCKSYEHAYYDTKFSLGVKALYCSELVYQSDYERRLQVSLEDIAGLGRSYISPTGILRARNCDVIWDSDREVLPTALKPFPHQRTA